MKFKHLIIGLIVLSIIVLSLNFILSRDVIGDYRVVGEGKDWLSFYGSLISSLVAFYALYRTIKNERNIANIDRRHQDLKDLRNDLSNRIAAINISQILQVVLAGNDFNKTSELYRLDALAQDYTKLSNSTFFKYEIADDDYAKAFYTAYCSFIDDLVKKDINDLTILLKEFVDEKVSQQEYNTRLLKISNRIITERQLFFTNEVCPAAKRYYKSESDKFKKEVNL